MVEIMKTSRKLIFLGMIVLLSSLIVGTTTTQAKPDRTTIEFVYKWISYGLPEREWISEEGIYHTIMTPHWGEIISEESPLQGDVYYIGNLVIFDLATFDGLGQGIFEFTGHYGSAEAGFEGKMHFKIKNAFITGAFVCHGSGALEGKLLKGTFEAFLGAPTSVVLVIWN